MTVVAVACVKNENDVVEAFVRHTLAFAHHLVVLDNGSSDGTSAILHALKKEGLSVEIVEDDSLGKYQSRRLMPLIRDSAVARLGATWVLPLDGDEFVVVPESGSLVPEGSDPNTPVSLRWRTYVPDPSDDRSEVNPVVRLRHRLLHEGWDHEKVLIPRSLAASPGLTLAHGNHGLSVDGQPCPTIRGQAYLAHLPLRGPEQYLAKIAVNSLQYQVMADRDANCGWHYRGPYELLKRDWHAFLDGFMEEARRYAVPGNAGARSETVADPIPYRGGPLLYTPEGGGPLRGWQTVLRYADDLARRHGVLLASVTDDGLFCLDKLVALLESLHAKWAHHISLLYGQYAHVQHQDRLLIDQREQFIHSQHRIRELEHSLQQQAQEYQQDMTQSRNQIRELERLQQQRAQEREVMRQHLVQEARCHEQALRRSWTWKVGRLLVGPLSRLKQARRLCGGTAKRLRCVPKLWPRAAPCSLETAPKILLGAGETAYAGWMSTDRAVLDVACRADFEKYWKPNSREAFLTEHVWEHLTESQAEKGLANCFEFLRAGGRLRIAVPDGLHPDRSYLDWVRPGGVGPGADDHKTLYDYRSLRQQVEQAGFRVRLLEYWDEKGRFHFRKWSSRDGHIVRSARHDRRNRGKVLNYTSLIIDAIKPAGVPRLFQSWFPASHGSARRSRGC